MGEEREEKRVDGEGLKMLLFIFSRNKNNNVAIPSLKSTSKCPPRREKSISVGSGPKPPIELSRASSPPLGKPASRPARAAPPPPVVRPELRPRPPGGEGAPGGLSMFALAPGALAVACGSGFDFAREARASEDESGDGSRYPQPTSLARSSPAAEAAADEPWT